MVHIFNRGTRLNDLFSVLANIEDNMNFVHFYIQEVDTVQLFEILEMDMVHNSEIQKMDTVHLIEI